MAEAPNTIDPIDGVSEEKALEVLSELHQRQIERFNARRQIEWRMTFTIWAGLLVTANVVNGIELTDTAEDWGIALLVSVVVFHLIWELVYVGRGASTNRDNGIELENAIRRTIGVPESPIKTYWGWAAHVLQVTMTFLLAALVYAAVGFNP